MKADIHNCKHYSRKKIMLVAKGNYFWKDSEVKKDGMLEDNIFNNPTDQLFCYKLKRLNMASIMNKVRIKKKVHHCTLNIEKVQK